MAVAAGIMVPHPPLIVPDVGRGQEILIKDTIKAYQEAAGMAAELKPDTIVVISPHAVMYADYFHVSPGKEARGDFGRFMAPQIGVEAGYDEAFVRELDRLCGDDDFPMGTEGEREKELDHGTLVPLYFINQHYRDYKLVRRIRTVLCRPLPGRTLHCQGGRESGAQCIHCGQRGFVP